MDHFGVFLVSLEQLNELDDALNILVLSVSDRNKAYQPQIVKFIWL